MFSVFKCLGWQKVTWLCLCLALVSSWGYAADKYEVYTVKEGDTLEALALKFRTTAEKIREQNSLPMGSQVKAGDQLIVPSFADVANSQVTGRLMISQAYAVQPGDTLEKIAASFRVSVESIKIKNGLKDNQSLQPGQMLMIPVREHIIKSNAPTMPSAELRDTPQNQVLMRGVNLPSRGAALPRFTDAVNPNPSSSAPSPSATKVVTPQLQSVGRLGTVIQSGGKIRRTKSAGGAVLYECSPGQQLVITGQLDDWYTVMMIDRTVGWIPKRYVRLEDQELLAPSPASNFSSAGDGSGNYPVIEEAFRYLGVPYRYGGTSTNGMDCSAFVQRCFRTVGVSLPRTAAEQSRVGTPVSPEELIPGDRLYFANSRGRVNHTGIYVGNGQFIHASGGAGQVVVSNLSESKYLNTFSGARR